MAMHVGGEHGIAGDVGVRPHPMPAATPFLCWLVTWWFPGPEHGTRAKTGPAKKGVRIKKQRHAPALLKQSF